MQNGSRVLVVDDDPMVAEVISRRLARAGFETRTVGDAAGGLAAVGDWQPDVCVIDRGLPGVDGLELAERIDAGVVERPRVLLISGSFMAGDPVPAAAGVDGLLAKPFGADELVEAVALLVAASPRHERVASA